MQASTIQPARRALLTGKLSAFHPTQGLALPPVTDAITPFRVVVPPLPGFGFSDKPREKGWNVVRIAKAWGTLMARLGYRRWVAQGGDWGAGVTTALGHVKPQGLAAIHLNWQFVFPEKMPA